jgi:hypothetical protein
MYWKRAVFSISVANLFLSPAWIIAFGSGSPFDEKFLNNAYHVEYELNHVDYISGILLTILIGFILYVLLSLWSSRRYYLEFGISLLAMVTFFDGFRRVYLHFLSLENILRFISMHYLVTSLLVVCAIVFVQFFFRRLKTVLEIAILVCSPLVIVFVANISYAAYLVRPTEEAWTAVDRSLAAPNKQKPKANRTVAILFDGWDYDLTFEKHDKSVYLANIERFRSESVFARNAQKFGRDTLRAVPAFTTGAPVTEVEHTNAYDLRLHFGNGKATSLWSEMDTVFDLAYRNGLNVSVAAGIYHQYCFLFRRSVSDCYPTFSHVVHRTNLLKSMGKVLLKALPLAHRITKRQTASLHPIGYVDEFLRLKAAMLDRVGNPNIGFLFVHIFLPHMLYFYDPKSEKYIEPNKNHENYFDQLILLDRVFGEIRSAMERANVWDDTNVLIFSDHPGPDIKSIPTTREFKRTNRIPLLLKLAGQRKTVTVDREVEARNLYFVLKELFENRLRNPDDVEKLLAGSGP